MNWFHRLFNPHCEHCNTCKSCEILAFQLEQERERNKELMDLLHPKDARVGGGVPFPKSIQGVKRWDAKRRELEKQYAKDNQLHVEKLKKDKEQEFGLKSVEELEDEVGLNG